MNLRWLAAWLRALRAEPVRALAVAGLILVTTLIAAGAPRVLDATQDQSLRDEAAQARAPVRDLELVQAGRIDYGPADDPLRLVETAGLGLESDYPAALSGLVSSSGLVIDTPLWHPSAGTPLDSVLNLRIQQDVESHLKLDAGRWPSGTTQLIPDPTPGAEPENQLVVLEGAMSSATAAKLELAVGGRLILQPEPSDALGANRAVRLAIDLVGTYTVAASGDPYWIDDGNLAGPSTYALGGFVEYVRGTLLLAPEAYPALMDATRGSALPLIYRWRSYVDPATLRSADLAPLSDALRRAETIYPPSTPTLDDRGGFIGPDGMSPAALQTGLLRVLAAHQARWQAGTTVLAILWSGVALVILVSIALVAELVARRRRSIVAIARRRGATRTQLGLAVLAEAVLLVVPAAAIGGGLAIGLVPGPSATSTVGLAGGIALASIALIGLAVVRSARSDDPARPRGPRTSHGGRRVAEILVVGLAVAGVVLLRQRTPTSTADGSAPGTGGSDPFLALAPALVGLAAGIVAVRVLPVLLGLVATLLARRRGLIAVLGLRRAARDGGVAAVLVVALTASTVGAFASALLDELDAGATAASWQAVGADFQVSGSADDLAAFRAGQPAGVEAESSLAVVNLAVSTGGTSNLLLIDPASAQAVAGGTPADPLLPAVMTQPATGSIPAIVSSPGEGSPPIALGQDFTVRIGGVAVPLHAVAFRGTWPAAPAGQPFLVVSRAQLAALSTADVPPATALLVRASNVTLAALQAVLPDRPDVVVQGRTATETMLGNAPAVRAVRLGILSGALAVLLYGLLTVVLAIGLDTAGRRRETVRLRVLGLSDRQATALVVIEFGPIVAIGVAAGLALGLGLISLIGPALGLPEILGVAGLLPAQPGAVRLVVVGLATLALVGAATVVSSLFERQPKLTDVARE